MHNLKKKAPNNPTKICWCKGVRGPCPFFSLTFTLFFFEKDANVTLSGHG